MWKDLTMSEKSDIMKLSIRNGITDLNVTKQIYDDIISKDNHSSIKDVIGLEGSKEGVLNKSSSSPNVYAQGGMMSVASKAKQYFVNKGMSDVAATGLVANLIRESNLNPNAINNNSGAYGLAQWLGARKKALFNKYGSKPTFNNQLDFIWNELNSSHKKGLMLLQQSKNIDEAAINAFGYYEFSTGPRAAVIAMNKSGQAGNDALNKGVDFARQLANGKLKGKANYNLSNQGVNIDDFKHLRYQENNAEPFPKKQFNAIIPTFEEDFYKPIEINIPTFNSVVEDLHQMGLGLPQVTFNSKIPEIPYPYFTSSRP